MSDELEGKVGFTNDGLIFHITEAVLPDGQKMQATFTYTPEQALSMARKYEAAVEAGIKAKKISEGASHGGSHSSTNNREGP